MGSSLPISDLPSSYSLSYEVLEISAVADARLRLPCSLLTGTIGKSRAKAAMTPNVCSRVDLVVSFLNILRVGQPAGTVNKTACEFIGVENCSPPLYQQVLEISAVADARI